MGGPAWPCYGHPDGDFLIQAFADLIFLHLTILQYKFIISGETEDRVPYEHVRAEGEQTDEAQNFCQHGLLLNTSQSAINLVNISTSLQ